MNKAQAFDREGLVRQVEDALTRPAEVDLNKRLPFDSQTLHRIAAALSAVARACADSHDQLSRELRSTIDDLSARITRLEQERQR